MKIKITDKEWQILECHFGLNGSKNLQGLIAENYSAVCIEDYKDETDLNQNQIAGLISSLEDKNLIFLEERPKSEGPNLYWFNPDTVLEIVGNVNISVNFKDLFEITDKNKKLTFDDKIKTIISFYNLNHKEIHTIWLYRLITLNDINWTTAYLKVLKKLRSKKRGCYDLDNMPGEINEKYKKTLVILNHNINYKMILTSWEKEQIAGIKLRKDDVRDSIFKFSITEFGKENAVIDLVDDVNIFIKTLKNGKWYIPDGKKAKAEEKEEQENIVIPDGTENIGINPIDNPKVKPKDFWKYKKEQEKFIKLNSHKNIIKIEDKIAFDKEEAKFKSEIRKIRKPFNKLNTREQIEILLAENLSGLTHEYIKNVIKKESKTISNALYTLKKKGVIELHNGIYQLFTMVD